MRENMIFPDRSNFYADEPEKYNLQIQTFGRRISADQTLYEYLIEFLLVFKGTDNGESGFSKVKDYNKIVNYEYNPNIALKRFIFLEISKQDNRYDIDEEANKILNKLLIDKIKSEDLGTKELLNIIKELYRGFTAFSGDRGWFAKALFPISKNTIFPAAVGKKIERKGIKLFKDKEINIDVDKGFQFNEHNFMARGGEVYFLHILQGLNKIREIQGSTKEKTLRTELENQVNTLINSFPQFENLSQWIQDTWIDYVGLKTTKFVCKEKIIEEIKAKSGCKWITKDFERRSNYTVVELNNLLRAEISEFEKFEIISLAIVFQILRMMTEASTSVATDNKTSNPIWVIDINSNYESDRKTMKLAVEQYKNIEENMMIAVARKLENIDLIKEKRKDATETKLLKDAYEDSHKLLRKLGKDIGFIIPIKGDNMRFTLNDKITKFLVLSLIAPGKKITLDTFLEKLYENFRIVIGVKEYEKYLSENGSRVKDASYLQYNLNEFQLLLRKNGFLKELSDATSIVINPYNDLEVQV